MAGLMNKFAHDCGLMLTKALKFLPPSVGGIFRSVPSGTLQQLLKMLPTDGSEMLRTFVNIRPWSSNPDSKVIYDSLNLKFHLNVFLDSSVQNVLS